MRLFVTGAGGHLGRTVARQALAAGHVVGGAVRASPAPKGVVAVALDVREPETVAAALLGFRPDAVVHTAYVQGVEAMEAVNVGGAAAVAAGARAAGARLVHLSSDAIFAGDLGRELREADPPTPSTPYGATKARAEGVVLAADPGAVLVRTSLIYGGVPAPRQELLALDPGGAFFVDEVRCPVHVDDLAAAVLELCELDVRGRCTSRAPTRSRGTRSRG